MYNNIQYTNKAIEPRLPFKVFGVSKEIISLRWFFSPSFFLLVWQNSDLLWMCDDVTQMLGKFFCTGKMLTDLHIFCQAKNVGIST